MSTLDDLFTKYAGTPTNSPADTRASFQQSTDGLTILEEARLLAEMNSCPRTLPVNLLCGAGAGLLIPTALAGLWAALSPSTTSLYISAAACAITAITAILAVAALIYRRSVVAKFADALTDLYRVGDRRSLSGPRIATHSMSRRHPRSQTRDYLGGREPVEWNKHLVVVNAHRDLISGLGFDRAIRVLYSCPIRTRYDVARLVVAAQDLPVASSAGALAEAHHLDYYTQAAVRAMRQQVEPAAMSAILREVKTSLSTPPWQVGR